MRDTPHISGQETAWAQPVPTPEFTARLRNQLLAQHSTLVDQPKTSRAVRLLQWFLLPTIVVAVAAVVFFVQPSKPLTGEQFLQQAQAAMMTTKQTGILYTRVRDLMIFEPTPYTPIEENPYAPNNTPIIRESWIDEVDGKEMMMFRDTLEDGTLLSHMLQMYRTGDTEIFYPDRTYQRWRDMSTDTPICILKEPTLEEQKARRAEFEAEEKEGITGTKFTYTNESDIDLNFQLQDKNMQIRLAALHELQRRGSVREVTEDVAPNQAVRVFRSDSFSTAVEQGKDVGPKTLAGYVLYWFDITTYRLVREETYNADTKGNMSLWWRKEYLEEKMIPRTQAAQVFDPNAYGLVDALAYLSVTSATTDRYHAKAGCYYLGKYMGENSFALLDQLTPELNQKTITVIQARAPIVDVSASSSSSFAP